MSSRLVLAKISYLLMSSNGTQSLRPTTRQCMPENKITFRWQWPPASLILPRTFTMGLSDSIDVGITMGANCWDFFSIQQHLGNCMFQAGNSISLFSILFSNQRS